MNAYTGLIRSAAEDVRGKIAFDVALAPYTWFRVGGPADALFSPADEEDLSAFLARLPAEVPVLAVGVGSNLIVRDGGVRGVVIRLGGRAFGAVEAKDELTISAGAAALDSQVARVAADAGISGLAFFRGVPGSIGGALRMNAGAHGGETKDTLLTAFGVDRSGSARTFDNADMGFAYRHSEAPDDVIFTRALFQGRPGDPAAIRAEMERVTAAREAAQPIREKTGGSTFKNPVGGKAWQAIDAAGCRGLRIGDAQVSEMHCNFLLNVGAATAADIEALGEEVRRRVREHGGVDLHWEIKRIGVVGD